VLMHIDHAMFRAPRLRLPLRYLPPLLSRHRNLRQSGKRDAAYQEKLSQVTVHAASVGWHLTDSKQNGSPRSLQQAS